MTKKCNKCKLLFFGEDAAQEICPECGDGLVEGCPMDVPDCTHTNVSGIATCPECGQFICPICGGHHVEVISRVTGYLSPVDSWNNGKKQELKDRVRYNV